MDRGPRGYIHIGPVKTGSTYIQRAFFQNSAVFERFGIAYPFVFPPPLDSTRCTNAQFLWDRSRDDDAKYGHASRKLQHSRIDPAAGSRAAMRGDALPRAGEWVTITSAQTIKPRKRRGNA